MSETAPTPRNPLNSDETFEYLVGDVMRGEPFPREIQVIGRGIAWAAKMRMAARARGWNLIIDVNQELDT